MPAVALAAAAFFTSAATAVSAAIGGAVAAGLGGSIAAISIGGFVADSVFAFATALPSLLLSAAVGAALAPKTPKPVSSGIQVSIKADPRAPIPVVFGETAVGPAIVYRMASGDKNVLLSMIGVNSIGYVESPCEAMFVENYLVNFATDPVAGLATVSSVTPSASGSKLFVNEFRACAVHGNADPAFSLAPPVYTGTAMPNLSSTSKLTGLSTIVLHLSYLAEAFPSGVPAKILTKMKGKWCWDPRLDSTYPGGSGTQRLSDERTWAYSENPYICGLNWTLGFFQNGKKIAGIGAKLPGVDVGAFVAAANIADTNGWKCGGQVTAADDKSAVLGTILQAGSGLVVHRGAQLSCIINAPKTSIYTVTTDDVVGQVEVTSSTPWRDRKNAISAHYREPNQYWTLIEGDTITSSTYVTEDGGETKTAEIEYTMCQDAAQAHQLAAYDLVNNREFEAISMVCKPRLLDVRVGEAITVNLAEHGVVSQKFIVLNRRLDPSTHQVTLQCRSETDAKHAFALGQTGTAPASPSLDTGYDPSNPPAPSTSIWSITATSITDTNGVVQPALTVTGAVDDPNAQSIIFEYQPSVGAVLTGSGLTPWLAYAEVPKSTTHIDITGVNGGTSYYVAVSYRVNGIQGQRQVLGPATAGAFTAPAGSVTYTSGGTTTTLATELAALAASIAAIVPTVPSFASNPSTSGLSDGATYYNTTDGKLYVLHSGSWVAINASAIPSGSTLPGSGTTGGLFFNTTDSKLYRWNGTAWTDAVAAADITGTITGTQIGSNTITAANIAANTITASQIAANTITASQIAASTITASQIAAGTITAAKIATGTITANEIASNTITAGKIAANTITSSQIQASSILASSLGVSTLSAITANIGTATAGVIQNSGGTTFFDLNNSRSQYAVGSYVFRLGSIGSGVVAWFGPSSVTIGSETRTNGAFAFGTDGLTYFGSAALSSGGGFSIGGSTSGVTANGFGAGAATLTTSSVTLTPSGNTGTVSYAWTAISNDAQPVTINLSGSPTGKTATFSKFCPNNQDRDGIAVCTATDGGSGMSATFSCGITWANTP